MTMSPNKRAVVTMRMTTELHDDLKALARRLADKRNEDFSLNKLCVEALQARVDLEDAFGVSGFAKQASSEEPQPNEATP